MKINSVLCFIVCWSGKNLLNNCSLTLSTVRRPPWFPSSQGDGESGEETPTPHSDPHPSINLGSSSPSTAPLGALLYNGATHLFEKSLRLQLSSSFTLHPHPYHFLNAVHISDGQSFSAVIGLIYKCNNYVSLAHCLLFEICISQKWLQWICWQKKIYLKMSAWVVNFDLWGPVTRRYWPNWNHELKLFEK